VVTGVPDQQHPASLIERKDSHRRHQQQIMPDGSPQPGDVRRDTHPRQGTATASRINSVASGLKLVVLVQGWLKGHSNTTSI
jgi:hypothetical protein